MTQAVIYTRISTLKQLDGTSLERQEEEGQAWCQQHGYTVVDVVTDVLSGYDTLRTRPGLQKVLAMVQHHEVQVVVVWKLDRLAREQVDGALILRRIAQGGARVESITEGGQVENTPVGKMLANIRNGFAEIERETIMLRTRPAIRRRAESGKLLINGRPKYGYVYTPQRDGYVPDEETAPVVKQLYAMVANGKSVHNAVRYLNDNRVPPPSVILQQRGMLPATRQAAQYWGRTQVYRILKDSAYKGQQVAYRFEQVVWEEPTEHGEVVKRKMMRMREATDSTRVVQSIPALVSEEQWEAVQAAIRGRTMERYDDDGGYLPLLTKGFVYCAHCGSRCGKERVKQRTGEYTYVYRCTTLGNRDTPVHKCPYSFSIRTPAVDAEVWEQVKDIAQNTERLQGLIRSRAERVGEWLVGVMSEQAAMYEEVKALHQQQTNLVRLVTTAPSEHIEALYQKELLDVTNRVTGLEDKLHRAETEEGHYKKLLDGHQEIARLVNELAAEIGGQPVPDMLDSLSREDKRRLLRALNVEVRLYSRKSDYFKENGKQWEFTFAPDEVAPMGIETFSSIRGPERRFW